MSQISGLEILFDILYDFPPSAILQSFGLLEEVLNIIGKLTISETNFEGF